jgi:hypothetical protein
LQICSRNTNRIRFAYFNKINYREVPLTFDVEKKEVSDGFSTPVLVGGKNKNFVADFDQCKRENIDTIVDCAVHDFYKKMEQNGFQIRKPNFEQTLPLD